ncbi:MAG TPA: CHAP domain-containing protein [Candidatus Dormibacteraeota bacterium]|nr:CHAP domain-containing protein [Candidatus Dormibacteraeota bacterium]
MNRIAAFVVAVVAAGLLVSPVASPITASAAGPNGVASAIARLDQLNNQLDQANASFDAANRKLAQDQQAETKLDTEISALARVQYQQPALIVQLFSAGSLSQVLGDISTQQLMATKESKLLLQARALRRQDQAASEQAQTSVTAAQSARDAAKQLADQAVADAAYQARALAVAQSAVAPTVVSAKWSGAGPYPNHFTYGYCTWYVANRRYVPWFGNAIDWWPNARPFGYAEGPTPRVGAIMVTRESGYGHVAYVESVNADGSWTVSEMNFTGWDQVDRRTIRPGQVPLVGFIY